jgi:RNA recognition motif-containing protein
VTGETLREKFSSIGPLTRCDVKRGFAFVTYEKEEDAQKAVNDFNGFFLIFSSSPSKRSTFQLSDQDFNGSKIKVEVFIIALFNSIL